MIRSYSEEFSRSMFNAAQSAWESAVAMAALEIAGPGATVVDTTVETDGAQVRVTVKLDVPDAPLPRPEGAAMWVESGTAQKRFRAQRAEAARLAAIEAGIED